MKIKDIMTEDVQCCCMESSLDEIAAKMWEYNCGSIPVVDAVAKPIGMITDRDIAMSCTLNHKAPWELVASTIVGEREVFSCSKDDNIETALAIMKANKIRRLAVTDSDGALAGMLSIDDIVAHSNNGKSAKSIPYDTTISALKSVAIPH